MMIVTKKNQFKNIFVPHKIYSHFASNFCKKKCVKKKTFVKKINLRFVFWYFFFF